MAKGLTLYKHQVETRDFILRNKKCFVLDEIGLGKTISTLEALEMLFQAGKIESALIIAPISVLVTTWVDHILKYYPHRTFQILHQPSRQKRVANLNRKSHYYIINTDGIKVIFDELYGRNFPVIVIDESTLFASHKSDRTKAAWSLCNQAKSVVCLTGEPTPNDLIQSYAQAKLIHYENPKYYTKFRDDIKIKLDMYNYIDRPGAVERVFEILQPAIKHTRDECLDLPPITFETREVQLSKEQEKLYKTMKDDYIAWLDSGEVATAVNAAVRYIKLLQISAGIIINDDGSKVSVDHKPRLKELDAIYDELPVKKLIVFAHFTKSIDGLMEHFGSKAARIDGSVKASCRAKIVKDFQEGDLEVLVCQPKAISHGVNLQACNTIVWWSPTPSNEAFNQCNGRIRRTGQLRPQLVIKFQSTSIEKLVFSALERKQKVSEALLEKF